jgi:hypothetical protein
MVTLQNLQKISKPFFHIAIRLPLSGQAPAAKEGEKILSL